jgi:hypothetical protein
LIARARDPAWGGVVGDAAFYLGGLGLAALVAALVAVLTLLVGAADALLDARRPLAAVGVDERTLVRALSKQLAATAVPAIAAGVPGEPPPGVSVPMSD